MPRFGSLYQEFKENYWPLVKSLQTLLLLATGLAGFISGRCPVMSWQLLVRCNRQLVSRHQRQYGTQHVVRPRYRRTHAAHLPPPFALRKDITSRRTNVRSAHVPYWRGMGLSA